MADEAAIPLDQRLRELKEDVEFSGGMGAMMSVTNKRFSVLAEACLVLLERTMTVTDLTPATKQELQEVKDLVGKLTAEVANMRDALSSLTISLADEVKKMRDSKPRGKKTK